MACREILNMGMSAETMTPLLEFSANRPFRFRQQNVDSAAEQSGSANESYLTTSEPFANQVLLRDPAQFKVIASRVNIPCLPRADWNRTDYTAKSVLFLLPGEALGEAAAMMLFISAFITTCKPKAVGVFCARSGADIYARDRRIKVFPLWVSRRDLRRWQVVIDLGQLESRRNIDFWPVDMESELLSAFGGLPIDDRRYPSEARAIQKKDTPLKIGILPLASSPLRTLLPGIGFALIEALQPFGDITLVLNAGQRQGQIYRDAVKKQGVDNIRVIDRFESIGDLVRALDTFDYAVFADSGPAHLSKLVALPGVAAYSSAPGDVLQGRFHNLARWTIPFEGPYCKSPCGLAKIRKAPDGRVGCMGSLGLTPDALTASATRADAAEIERLQSNPVPCMASLLAAPGDLVRFTVEDLQRRLQATTSDL